MHAFHGGWNTASAFTLHDSAIISMRDFRILAGTGNPALAASIARQLGVSLAVSAIDRFPDGEVSVRLLEPVQFRRLRIRRL